MENVKHLITVLVKLDGKVKIAPFVSKALAANMVTAKKLSNAFVIQVGLDLNVKYVSKSDYVILYKSFGHKNICF